MLILALIFVVLMAVSLLAIVNFAGDGLLSTTNLRGTRSLEYAADSATDAAIQAVRYSWLAYDGAPNPAGDCLPDGVVLTVPDSATMQVNGITMTVVCTGTRTVGQQNTRTFTFAACQNSPCSSASANAIIVAKVSFQDYSSAGVYDCSSSPDSATCGTGEVLQSWIVKRADN